MPLDPHVRSTVTTEGIRTRYSRMATPEHAPGPTPTRAVYGFSMFLLFKTLFFLYFIWALVPDSVLRGYFSLTYLPDKYFAIFIPMMILVAVSLFAFFIYPGIGLLLTPHINDEKTVRDSYSISPCQKDCQRPAKVEKDSWKIHQFCEIHEDRKETPVEDTISDFCDCPANTRCVLRENPGHLECLRGKKQIAKARDLPISDVCRVLYRK
ncbi:phosphatidylinositol N-acetylglucosaminyltransferase subunit P [Phlebotomus argentipes]|uniref:phosphatidylinositol N-acetylglucosaminyltransferase subunit P n=1 Tax=Phlebotomus argentipes TaxID=94469 RepID=UPI002892A7E1|nr:phosphatidylinositol N-acetylglucosaminyltransferase subunit P [Phlebotomus argentipes]